MEKTKTGLSAAHLAVLDDHASFLQMLIHDTREAILTLYDNSENSCCHAAVEGGVEALGCLLVIAFQSIPS